MPARGFFAFGASTYEDGLAQLAMPQKRLRKEEEEGLQEDHECTKSKDEREKVGAENVAPRTVRTAFEQQRAPAQVVPRRGPGTVKTGTRAVLGRS